MTDALASRSRRRSRARLACLVVVMAMIAAACGSSLSDEEVLAANGVSGSGETAAVGGGGTTTATIPGQAGTAARAGTPGSAGGTNPAAGGGAGGASGPGPGGPSMPVEGGGGGGPGAAQGGEAVGTPGETGPIVIGSVGNYSGPAGVAQAGIGQAVQVWAASVNSRGGLFGREVQVILQDDGGDPARYGAAVRDLVENRGVVAFVGNGASLSAQGGADYLTEKQIPVIGNECSLDLWFNSPVFFPQCPTVSDFVTGIFRSGVQLTDQTRFGIAYCSEAQICRDFDEVARGGAVEAAGGELAYRGQISLTQIDFTAECRNAADAGVELMLIVGDPNTLARWVRSCDRQGFDPTYVQGSATASGDSNQQPGLEDMVLATNTFPFAGVSSPAFDEFRQAVETFAGQPPSPALSLGWASAKAFEEGATRAARATQSINPQSLIDAMRTFENETLGGLTVPLTFTPEGARPAPCYFVMRSEGGNWTAPFGPEQQCL